jgi:hypothetical protein
MAHNKKETEWKVLLIGINKDITDFIDDTPKWVKMIPDKSLIKRIRLKFSMN